MSLIRSFHFKPPSRLHSDGKLSYQSGMRAASVLTPEKRKSLLLVSIPFRSAFAHLKENVCAAALTWERRRDLCAAHNQVSGLMSGENGHYAATDRRGGFRRTRGLLRYCVYCA
jgi:hypothetical protein